MLNLPLENIVQKKNLSVQDSASLKELIEIMNHNQKGVVVVLKDEQPLGILTERDVVEVLYHGIHLDDRVDKYAKKKLISTRGDRTAGYALNLTIDNNIRRVVITDAANKFLGIVTQQDLLRYLEEDFYRLTLKVKHIIEKNKNLLCVSPGAALTDVLTLMVEHNVSSVPVVENNVAVGIITEKDILTLTGDNVPLENQVEKYMSSPVDTASLGTALVEIVEVMNYRNIRRIVVVDDDGLARNIITIRDVVKNLESDYSQFLEKKLDNAKEILNLLPAMIVEVSDTGKEQVIVWANDKVISQFGRDVINTPVTHFFPRKSWDKIHATLNTLNKIENIKIKKDERIYELSGFFLSSYGIAEKGRCQLIMRDITEDIVLSTLDPLTNLYNRRFINEFLMREIERCGRLQKHFSIVICDMDNFKKINDTYGHISGDEVLKSVSRVMTGTVRNLDVVGRYGGDEFVIILPETPSGTAYQIMDRLRYKIENLEVQVLDNRKITVTTSFGIATFPHDGTSSDDLLITGDERLYKAKSSGKNKVIGEKVTC